MKELRDASAITTVNYDIEGATNFPILNDVYTKIRALHYDSAKIKDSQLVE
jgi:hypothetical protein